MNKKLERAMEEAAEAFADQEGELISKDGPTGVQDNRKSPDGFLDQWMMRHGYKAGFQKGVELMQADIDKLVEALNMDCGDNSCMFAKKKTGMRTNGGCSCFGGLNLTKRLAIRKALAPFEKGEK